MLSAIDSILQVVGLLGQATLLYVLLSRKRALSFPIFTSWMAYLEIETIIDFLVRTTMSGHAYFLVFWALGAPEYILQIGVLYEIARNVLLPNKKNFSLKVFWVLGGLIFLSSLVTVFAVTASKHGAPGWLEGSLNTTSLILSLSRCLLFAGITLFSNVLGLSWRNHVQRIATGLAIYSLIDFVVDYEYTVYQNSSLDYYRIVAYLISLLYWIRTLSLPEPERKPLAPQVEALVYRVHQAVIADRKLLEDIRDRK